nr:hypothetical protein [Tanacetum cinerariifolium]
FPGPKVHGVSAPIENNLDYAKELARLQRQEHEAHSADVKYGFELSYETAEMLHQAELKTRRDLVLATGDPADFVGCGDPAASESVSAVFTTNHAAVSPFPPGHSLGSSEHSIRFPSPSDLGHHQPTAGIFSSSSYDDDFYAGVTNIAL